MGVLFGFVCPLGTSIFNSGQLMLDLGFFAVFKLHFAVRSFFDRFGRGHMICFFSFSN